MGGALIFLPSHDLHCRIIINLIATSMGPPSPTTIWRGWNNSKNQKTYFYLNNSKRFSSFLVPLYAKVPKIRNGGLINWKEFAKCYELCLEGLSPERIKIPRDVTVEEMHKCFGVVHNKNGYSYVFSEDPMVIAKVESLWVVIHQNPFVLTSRIISLGMARGVVMELNKGRKMNWVMYVEWTN